MKKNWWTSHKYEILAWFFVALQILIIIRNFNDLFVNFFWFCDFTPILIAFGFWKRNNSLIKGIVNVILLPQMVFLVGSILGTFIYPFTDITYLSQAYLGMNYLDKGIFYFVVTFVTHLASLLAMIHVFKIKGKDSSLRYSGWLIVLTFLASRFLTSGETNVNYVFSFGKGIIAGLSWIVITYFVLAIPTKKLQDLLNWVLGEGRKYFWYDRKKLRD